MSAPEEVPGEEQPALKKRSAWSRRLLGWGRRALFAAGLGVGVLLGACLGLLTTDTGLSLLRDLGVRAANQQLLGTLELDSLSGSLLSEFQAKGLRLRDAPE